ncbi:Endonuclease/exonuclease/phosphatase [Dactylonectria estremocensis]|uniref:Endonuclease/exonuclease/phosphatase n=1 Tax=Dactylonectria estremocensis TaxID=1079267 RepID=A0A9P9JF36_9HYPO|nr:Endonuclease/exonuclease/phosphatase [Dactylonectria estremocensis]
MNVSLPTELGVASIFQPWHEFDADVQRWVPARPSSSSSTTPSKPSPPQHLNGDLNLSLVTWNIDAGSHSPRSRTASILSHLLTLTPPPHVIFLQEVSKLALTTPLEDPRLQQNWYSSEADSSNWQGHIFATMILLSKSRFGHLQDAHSPTLGLGPLWRVKYRSRFGRDALCCDVLVPSSSSHQTTPIRLVNVHLDSLPIQPSRRPEQLSTIASILRCAGRGLVAGDFNPVLPQDATLVEDNQLIDAWIKLHGQESGFTWGVDGEKPFPPTRLDKVAVLGLEPEKMKVMHPGIFSPSGDNGIEHQEQDWGPTPWSDHSGLRCSLRIPEENDLNP